MDWNGKSAEVSEMLGKTLKSVDRVRGGDSEELHFKSIDGDEWRMGYISDCCALCDIDDLDGQLQDLVGSPITQAEMVSNDQDPPGFKVPECRESYTWTFVKLATKNGYVTVRWYGESNGYYSETPSFHRIRG